MFVVKPLNIENRVSVKTMLLFWTTNRSNHTNVGSSEFLFVVFVLAFERCIFVFDYVSGCLFLGLFRSIDKVASPKFVLE